MARCKSQRKTSAGKKNLQKKMAPLRVRKVKKDESERPAPAVPSAAEEQPVPPPEMPESVTPRPRPFLPDMSFMSSVVAKLTDAVAHLWEPKEKSPFPSLAPAKNKLTFAALTAKNQPQVEAFFKFHEMDGPKSARNKRQWVSLAYVEDFLVGALMATVSPTRVRGGSAKRVYIDALAVFKPYRRLQVGKQLVEQMLERAQQEGAQEVTLHTPACFLSAHRFYTRLGFKEAARVPRYYSKADGDHAKEAVVFNYAVPAPMQLDIFGADDLALLG
jgi:ribosomal protein S18 acetylase RimI-like enzyme